MPLGSVYSTIAGTQQKASFAKLWASEPAMFMMCHILPGRSICFVTCNDTVTVGYYTGMLTDEGQQFCMGPAGPSRSSRPSKGRKRGTTFTVYQVVNLLCCRTNDFCFALLSSGRPSFALWNWFSTNLCTTIECQSQVLHDWHPPGRQLMLQAPVLLLWQHSNAW